MNRNARPATAIKERTNMIQVIGLIIAVYAITRLIQVPLELFTSSDALPALPVVVRLSIVAGISIIGLLFLGLLTLLLLFCNVDVPR
jgi:hypothetical protein